MPFTILFALLWIISPELWPVPVGHRFGALARTSLLDLCSPRPASGRGAGGEG